MVKDKVTFVDASAQFAKAIDLSPTNHHSHCQNVKIATKIYKDRGRHFG